MLTDRLIINYFFQTSKGIRGTARHFGIKKTLVGSIINKYKKKYNIK